MANGGEVVFDFKGNDKDLQKSSGKVTNTLKNIGKVGITAMATATTAVAGAFAGMVGASVKARADIEQSIGGVETLFKKSSDTVIKNAEIAYKTAGVSANQYMEQVTSFSASLLQSLGGDTEKASKVADRAIIDMADNANKMGTSVELLQNAYQGFAKGNYTMLDNLKLGYGGTKTEMERLVKDASKMTDVQKELGVTVDAGSMSFANIVNAISVMQEKLDIAGTTQKEATETLAGSFSMLQSAWQNFLSGAGDMSQVVESANYVFQNLMRIVGEAVPHIINSISESFPQIMELGGEILNKLYQGITQNLANIGETALNIVKTLITGLISKMPDILKTGIDLIVQLITGIAQMLPELIPQAVDCIITLVEGLLDNIDKLVDAGIELIIGLTEGLIEAMPRLVEKAPVIIEKLFLALIRSMPKLLQAGGKLIGELAVGIVASIAKLVEVAPKIISALVRGIKGLLGEVKNAGRNIVNGLWQGISNMAGWLADKVRNFAKNILNNMKDALGIHSPSTLFRDVVGKNLALGIGVGFEDEMNNVSKMMQGSMLELGDMFDLSPTLNGTATSSSNVTVNVYNNMETDLMGNLVNRIKTYSNGSKNDYNYGMA